MSNANYCHSCGRPLEANARFCEACGKPVLRQSTNMAQTASYDHQRYAQPVMQARPPIPGNAPERKKNIVASIVIILVGLFLLLLAIRLPMLNLIGTETVGQVVGIDRVVDSSTSSMDYTYRVSYVFIDDNGKSIETTFDMPRAYDFSKVPREGTMISIKYLSAWSRLNVPVDYNNSPLGAVVMILLGIGLIILGASGKVSFSRRKYRR